VFEFLLELGPIRGVWTTPTGELNRLSGRSGKCWPSCAKSARRSSDPGRTRPCIQAPLRPTARSWCLESRSVRLMCISVPIEGSISNWKHAAPPKLSRERFQSGIGRTRDSTRDLVLPAARKRVFLASRRSSAVRSAAPLGVNPVPAWPVRTRLRRGLTCQSSAVFGPPFTSGTRTLPGRATPRGGGTFAVLPLAARHHRGGRRYAARADAPSAVRQSRHSSREPDGVRGGSASSASRFRSPRHTNTRR
jgi:hypothetical protein